MQHGHQKAVPKSVMLGHASHTLRVMQNVHDERCMLPDPDIFAMHRRKIPATADETTHDHGITLEKKCVSVTFFAERTASQICFA